MESLIGNSLIFSHRSLQQIQQLQAVAAAASSMSANSFLPMDMNLLLQLQSWNASAVQPELPLAPVPAEARPRLTWTEKEDAMLKDLIRQHGTNKWALVASKIRTKTNKQCRRRWQAFLNAMGNKGVWTPEEDAKLLEGHRLYGNRWTEIARMVPGRTDNAAKNRFAALTAKRNGSAKSSDDVSDEGWNCQVGDSSSGLDDVHSSKRSRCEVQSTVRSVKRKIMLDLDLNLDLNLLPETAFVQASPSSSECSELEQCFLPDLNSPVSE